MILQLVKGGVYAIQGQIL